MNDIHKNICILLKYLNSWFVSGGSAGRCLWSFGVLALWLRRLRLGRARGYHQDMWPWFFSADGGAVGGPGLLGGVVMASHPHYQVRFVTNSHTHTHREDPMFVCVSVIFSVALCLLTVTNAPVGDLLCFICTFFYSHHFSCFAHFSSFYSFLPSLALLYYTYIKFPSSNTGMPQKCRTDKDNYITCW